MIPHPATLDEDALLAACDVRRQRRSGPGGQHRNKVETAVVIVHLASGIRGEASERRSQAENRRMALHRLRIKLALGVRSDAAERSGANTDSFVPSLLWQSRLRGERIEVSASHADFPALLAEALDCLAAFQLDAKLTAERLGCTPSQLVKFLKLEPEALQQVNQQRAARGLKALR